MRKRIGAVVALAALVSLTAACGDEAERVEQGAREVGREAREGLTTLASRMEGATRLRATLTGAAEIPGPGDSDGTGTASVNLDASKGEVCYEVSVQRIDRPTAMHIHDAETGKAGGIVLTLTTPTASDTTTTGCTNAERTLMSRMAADPDNFYVNVHTDTYPQGAVRGQLSQ